MWQLNSKFSLIPRDERREVMGLLMELKGYCNEVIQKIKKIELSMEDPVRCE
jgi:hypothetical protein